MWPKIKNFAETFTNKMLNVVDSSHGSNKYDSSSSLSTWRCPRCTLINIDLLKNCEICDYQRESTSLNNTICLEDTPPLASRLRTNEEDSILDRSVSSPTSSNRQKATSIGETYINDEQRAKRISTRIIDYCKREGIKFVDDSFPPCDKSLFIRGRPDKFKNQLIQWRSPHLISVPREDARYAEWVVFRQPSFNDIKQGLLGNCWFLSALAVIIEQPELLDKILITKTYCQQGVYQIRLCLNGKWEIVIVDELFPCDERNRLINSKAVRKQLWVILVEKALAKLNGSYEALIGGLTVEGLATLTGYPCELVEVNEKQDSELLWAKLLSYKEAGFLLGVSCGKSGKSEIDFEQNGLLSNHAYSILDIKQHEQNRLLKVRNPWGHLSWRGKWSNNSSVWTPRLRLALNGTQKVSTNDEGIFWIEFDDFIKYFSTIDVCKIRSNWMENRVSGMFATEKSTQIHSFHMIVFENCLIDLSLFQQNTKNRREASELDVMYMVVRYAQTIGRLVFNSKRQVRKFVGGEHLFEPGEYLIIPLSFNSWYSSDASLNFQYNLVLHGSKSFFLEHELRSPTLLADALIELCIRKGKQIGISIQGVNIYSLNNEFSGEVVVAENLSTSGLFYVEVDATNSTNVVSTREALRTSDTLKPLTRQVLMVLTHFESSAGYMLDFKFKYRYTQTMSSHSPALNQWTMGLHAPRHV